MAREIAIRDNITEGLVCIFSVLEISNFKQRSEGVRVKHSINANSVKIYNKAGSVLRIETTINRPNEFKTYRPVGETDEMKWQPLQPLVFSRQPSAFRKDWSEADS